MPPVVSVIIPNYNKGELVHHSLGSLLRQTHADWEAFVVDDCSSDESWATVQMYAANDSRIISVRNETNRGGNYCRNLGVKMSHGEYLIFLDSDDWLADDCIENRIREMKRAENKSADILVFPMASTKDGKGGSIWKSSHKNDALIGFLRHEIPWSTMMPIWRRTTFERTGGFDEAFPRLQDVELHTRALLQGLKYKFSERTTPDCFYFVDDSRMTTNYEKFVEIFVSAVEMYILKTKQIIIDDSGISVANKRKLLCALAETKLAALRNVGDLAQSGKISKNARTSLFKRILHNCDSDIWSSLYAKFYMLGLNRIRGFNFIYRRLKRLTCS